jgi:hypothetical protein
MSEIRVQFLTYQVPEPGPLQHWQRTTSGVADTLDSSCFSAFAVISFSGGFFSSFTIKGSESNVESSDALERSLVKLSFLITD